MEPAISERDGVLASQHLAQAVEAGWIRADPFAFTPDSIQPASIDLRLGDVAYALRCSFLPDEEPVEEKVKEYTFGQLDLTEGAVLEVGRPYLIPLIERLDLPEGVRGRTNPKSSTGRLDVFTRVITDHGHRFDEVRPGYRGRLYLEVVPLSFTIRVREHLALNQLRLMVGRPQVRDSELREWHEKDPLLFCGGGPVPLERLGLSSGLFLSLDLSGDDRGRVGYRAKMNRPPIDMSLVDQLQPRDYWDPVHHEAGDRLVLEPEAFYLLLSQESVRIPPALAAEMAAYDPTSGELRTHYAGFFDPGFGYDPTEHFYGSRAALEVRAHNVPFMVEHGQQVCKLSFERMLEPPEILYGEKIGSSYQRQEQTLSKHFHVEPAHEARGPAPSQPNPNQLSFLP